MKRCFLINIFKHIKLKNNFIKVRGFAFTRVSDLRHPDTKGYEINVNNQYYKVNFLWKKGIPFLKNYNINVYWFSIPLDDLLKADIQNKINLSYNREYLGRIIYSAFDLKKGRNRNSKIIRYNHYAIYLRQTIYNTMYLTIREANQYDSLLGKLKINVGFILSKFFLKKDLIILFEKESSRYEESASILYEHLIDQGYKNAYYIINQDNPKLSNIKPKYQKNLIYKDSLKHIIYFFKAYKFIGTESLEHAFQLRIANRKVLKKLNSAKLQYVFLQHGVTYMISLDADLRVRFKKQPYKLHKVVVSSMLEAKHFIEQANFSLSDLYICGMPKFDVAVKNDKADKIVIMPTWRRWEVNLAAQDYQKTKYFQMIKRIVESIPKDLQDKVIVLPHPLMLKPIKKNPQFEKYLPKAEFSYDEILKDCKLLITDYSSISYDAFYRGSNVIFYWEEKEECLKKYGGNAKLMLTSDKAFGDVCYNKEELAKAIRQNYEKGQSQKYMHRYQKIVSFHDNKNTHRLITMLKKDKII